MTKQEIIAHESSFQRVCDAYVRRHIGPCVSSLMYDVGQNLEECSRIFDFDYDEALGWFQVPDYESAVDYFIDNADLDDLETIADMVSSWSDVIGDIPTAIEVAPEDGGWVIESLGLRGEDEDEVNQEALEKSIKEIRSKVKAMISNQSYQEISEHFNLEPDYNEALEFWVLNEGYFMNELQARGEIVFEFCNLRIWGRTTSGQSIAIDYVTTQMVKSLPEGHWVWRECD